VEPSIPLALVRVLADGGDVLVGAALELPVPGGPVPVARRPPRVARAVGRQRSTVVAGVARAAPAQGVAPIVARHLAHPADPLAGLARHLAAAEVPVAVRRVAGRRGVPEAPGPRRQTAAVVLRVPLVRSPLIPGHHGFRVGLLPANPTEPLRVVVAFS